MCCILTFDAAKHAIPKTAEVTHSDGSYGKKSRRRAWLAIWDKVKSHGTVIDWCTGREWPVKHAIPKILGGVKDQAKQGGKGTKLVIVQEIKIWLY